MHVSHTSLSGANASTQEGWVWPPWRTCGAACCGTSQMADRSDTTVRWPAEEGLAGTVDCPQCMMLARSWGHRLQQYTGESGQAPSNRAGPWACALAHAVSLFTRRAPAAGPPPPRARWRPCVRGRARQSRAPARQVRCRAAPCEQAAGGGRGCCCSAIVCNLCF